MLNKEQEQNKEVTNSPTSSSAPSTKPKRRRLRTVRTMTVRAILVLLFGLGFFLSVFPLGRAVARTVLLLPSLITAAEPAPLTAFDEPARHFRTTVPSHSGTVFLDVYEPTTSPPSLMPVRGGVVIIPGAGDNRTVPQLVNFSLALAHAGFVVMDMTTPTLMAADLSANDSDAVVQAFEALAHWPHVGANRVGIIGFSAGGPLACFAAVDSRIRDQVAFIALFGGYFNAGTLLRAFGRRALMVEGQTVPWYPQLFPIQVLTNVIAGALPPSDGSILVKDFRPSGKPLSSSKLAQLSPPAAAAYHLLVGDEPDQVDANFAALSPPVRALLDTLSPSLVIDKIHTPIYLLHDRNDQSLPFTESRDFAAALARIHHPYDYAEFGIFEHVQVRSNLAANQLFSDVPNLFRVLNEVVLAIS